MLYLSYQRLRRGTVLWDEKGQGEKGYNQMSRTRTPSAFCYSNRCLFFLFFCGITRYRAAYWVMWHLERCPVLQISGLVWEENTHRTSLRGDGTCEAPLLKREVWGEEWLLLQVVNCAMLTFLLFSRWVKEVEIFFFCLQTDCLKILDRNRSSDYRAWSPGQKTSLVQMWWLVHSIWPSF